MKTFGTQGPVNPKDNYVVSRTEEIADFVDRIKKGKYIVLFAPRQTGKTTLFRAAMDTLASEDYFPIQLNFEAYIDLAPTAFYGSLLKDIRGKIERVIESQGSTLPKTLSQFLDNTDLTDHFSMRNFFQQLAGFLPHRGKQQKVVIIIDEFDAIPPDAVRGFLHSLRYIY